MALRLTFFLGIFVATFASAQDLVLPRYIESSAGLSPPELDGGRLEVELDDIDQDGHVDLISVGDHGSPYVNTDQHGIMVFFGNGLGQWQVVQVGNFGYGGLAIGDIDNDTHLDVAYGIHHDWSSNDFGDQILEVALGDGTGLSWTPWDDGLATQGETWGMHGTDLADVDGDGDLDVASLSFGCCAGLHVYLNQGDGSWVQSFGFLGGNSSMLLDFGDVNGDGCPDMAVGHDDGTIYLGDGQGGFTLRDAGLPSPSWRRGTDLGDLNGDGKSDLTFVNRDGGIEAWTYTDAGTWTSIGDLPTSGSFEGTQIEDLNRDGVADIIAFGHGILEAFLGSQDSYRRHPLLVSPGPGSLAAFRIDGDADHNGYPDIVVVAEEGPWLGSSNVLRFYKETSIPTALDIQSVSPIPNSVQRAGSIGTIEWTSADPSSGASRVYIALSTNGEQGPFQTIARDLPNNGRYQWRIPQTPSDRCLLALTVLSPTGTAQGRTPGFFEIR